MNIKSKLIAFFSMTILVVALAACNSGQNDSNTIDDNTTTQNDGTMNDTSKVDDAYEKAIAIKTRVYDEKIDSLNREISVLQDSYLVLSDKFKAYEESSKFWNIAVIIALVLSVIEVFIIFWIQKKVTEVNKLKATILNSREIKDLKEKIDNLCSNQSSPQGGRKPLQSASNELSRETQDFIKMEVENYYKKIVAQQNSRPNQLSIGQGNGIQKEYYVSSVNDIYLMNPTPSRHEKSVFRICETSSRKGTFDILEFEFAQVRQLNGLDKIIEYIPSGINIQSAEYVKTDKKGECEKEGDAWKVTQPVRIKIEKR